MPTFNAPTLHKGDQVRYTARFLRSTGQVSDPNGPGWGTVEEPPKEGDVFRLARVRWSDGHVSPVNIANLQKRGDPERPGVDFDPDLTSNTKVV